MGGGLVYFLNIGPLRLLKCEKCAVNVPEAYRLASESNPLPVKKELIQSSLSHRPPTSTPESSYLSILTWGLVRPAVLRPNPCLFS